LLALADWEIPPTVNQVTHLMGHGLTRRWATRNGDAYYCDDCEVEVLILGPACFCGFDGRKE
jgi:hypothetical protein